MATNRRPSSPCTATLPRCHPGSRKGGYGGAKKPIAAPLSSSACLSPRACAAVEGVEEPAEMVRPRAASARRRGFSRRRPGRGCTTRISVRRLPHAAVARAVRASAAYDGIAARISVSWPGLAASSPATRWRPGPLDASFQRRGQRFARQRLLGRVDELKLLRRSGERGRVRGWRAHQARARSASACRVALAPVE